MRRSLMAGALAVLLAVPVTALAAPANKPPDKRDNKNVKIVVVKKQGDAFCFDREIALGNTIVAGGRCYTFYLLRTHQGAFLAFGPPGPPMIPPGQIVRLSTPAGAKHKGRLFYLIPVVVPVTVIRVDEIRHVPVVVTPQPGRVVITVPSRPPDVRTTTQGSTDRDPELVFLQR